MSATRRFLTAMAGAALFASSIFAQSVISAHSGLVHHTEGVVLIDGKAVEAKFAQFPDVKEGQTLTTMEGRAEVLLSPGSVLRVAENSAIKMISNRLADTRIELLSGSILAEISEYEKGSHSTFLLGGRTVEVTKKGLIRLDAASNLLRVYDGEAVATAGGTTTTIKEGRQAVLNAGVLMPEKFDTKTGDAFYRWALRRAEGLAAANVSAARRVANGYSGTSYSGWYWNPYLGMFTYLPLNGIYMSPFGYRFYSPRSIYQTVYVNPNYGNSSSGFSASNPHYDPGLGYNVGSRSSAGFNSGTYSGGGGGSSSGGGSAPAAAAAPSARSGDTGGARDSGGRGR